MLREQVLEAWKNFKKGLLDDHNLLKALNDNLTVMTFSASGEGDGIKQSCYQVMHELKTKLPSITQNCQELRDKYIGGQFSKTQLIWELWRLYVCHIGLVETYQKIIEYYDDSCKSGPTIEEVD